MSKNDLAEDIVENIIGEKEYYRHGGSTTPQYHCPHCHRAHTKHSKIGKAHRCYERRE